MRTPALDALRGIAAFAVLTHHCVLAGLIPIPPGAWTALSRYTPLHLFVNGRAPVILFFVLSGFVLARSLAGQACGLRPGLRFGLRRLCRIYLPFVAVLLLAAVAERATAGWAMEAEGWRARLWSEAATPARVAEHLLMPVAGADLTLDRVAWSLVHEIRVSLFFPLLLAIARVSPALLAAGGVGALAIGHRASGCASLACLPFNGTDTASSFAATLYFAPFFLGGLLLARAEGRLAPMLPQAGAGRIAAWAVALYAMIVPFKFGLLPDLPVGFGAAGVILLVATGAEARTLPRTACLSWLGRVSFSLYLVHLPVLALVLRLGGGLAPVPLLALTLGGALLGAELLYRAVEAPALRLSRSVTRFEAGSWDDKEQIAPNLMQ